MEHYHALIESAHKKLVTADRFLNFTFHIVNEPKLLLGVAENLLNASTDMMTALLYFDLKYKFIQPFKEELHHKLSAFRQAMLRHNLAESSIKLIEELNAIVLSHKSCPVEFVKNKSLIMCSKNYECRALTFEMTLEYFKKAKIFINSVEQSILKHERDYRRFS
jgi:hypothetical protein